MRNYKMVISYDGTKYKGWQRLANDDMTIQSQLEHAISQVLGYEITIDGSGRTDSGVHARGQVANVKVSRRLDEAVVKNEINERLPEDMVLRSFELVKNSFHSRYSAKGKRYIYTIDNGEKPHVFSRKYTYHFPGDLDLLKMQQAKDLLVGLHDFTAFCDKKDEKSGVRTIYDIKIVKKDNIIEINYYGSGFLNHMVRILTGTLIEVGNGQKEVEDVLRALESGMREDAGYTAPSRGLALEKVYY